MTNDEQAGHNGYTVTRRDMLRFIATGAGVAALGAVAGRVPDAIINYEDPDLRSAREVMLDDRVTPEYIANPEDVKEIVIFAAIAYIHLTGRGKFGTDFSRSEELHQILQSTVLCENKTVFVNSVNQARADAGNSPRDISEIANNWGSHVADKVFINLQPLSEDTGEFAVHPGIFVTSLLFHEWIHLETKETKEGHYLNKGYEFIVFTDDDGNTKKEPYLSYTGGLIESESLQKFDMFDEAWTEVAGSMLMEEFISDNPNLRSDLLAYGAVNYYRNRVVRLKKLVRVLEMSPQEVWQLHVDSNLEKFLLAIGGLFKDEALKDIYSDVRDERTDEELLIDRDWVIGQQIAGMLSTENYTDYQSFMRHLRN